MRREPMTQRQRELLGIVPQKRKEGKMILGKVSDRTIVLALLLLIVLILLGGLKAAYGEEGVVTKDIPYSEDFQAQFTTFIVDAAKELSAQKCSHVQVMAFPKEDAPNIVTLMAACVAYHKEETRQ